MQDRRKTRRRVRRSGDSGRKRRAEGLGVVTKGTFGAKIFIKVEKTNGQRSAEADFVRK